MYPFISRHTLQIHRDISSLDGKSVLHLIRATQKAVGNGFSPFPTAF